VFAGYRSGDILQSFQKYGSAPIAANRFAFVQQGELN
jgi:hypothetical protein